MNTRIGISAVCISLAAMSFAANPFLDAPGDKPVSALFRGTEWSDEHGSKDLPLSATVVTTAIAKMSWGKIFKIEFVDVKSKTKRQIPPEYFIATDDRIALLNEENNDAAVEKLKGSSQAPQLEANDIYAVATGKLEHDEGPWHTTVEVKGDRCIYQATHGSGHFKTVIWQRGVGLVEYASGYGAHADGYRLKRVR